MQSRHLRVLADGTYVAEVVPNRSATATWTTEALPSGGGSAPGDALALSLMRRTAPDRRHLVVVFTVGTAYFNVLDDDVVARVAARSDAVLYVVGGQSWTGGSVNVGRPSRTTTLLALDPKFA